MCSIVDVEVVVAIHVQAGELGVVLIITCTAVIRIITVAFLTIINIIIIIINIIIINIIIINIIIIHYLLLTGQWSPLRGTSQE